MKITKYGAIIETDTHIGKWVEETGRLDFDQSFFKAIRQFVKPNMCIVDAGANIGAYTYGFSKMLNTYGSIHAFEPLPNVYECLKHNTKDLKNVKTYNLALGSKKGVVNMITEENIGASRISNEGNIKVNIIDLDSVELNKCDLIKVDIEGFEIDFLEGAKKTIFKYKPVLIMEVNKIQLERQGRSVNELFDKLNSLGYLYRNIYPNEGLTDVQFDIVCY
jgi:FkbM family methyltransferase